MSIAHDKPGTNKKHYCEILYEGHDAVFVPQHTDYDELAARWIKAPQTDLVDLEDKL